MLSDQGRVFYGLFACCSKRNPNSVEIPWWKQLACWTWRCNPLVWIYRKWWPHCANTMLVSTRAEQKKQLRGVFRRRCALRDNICIIPPGCNHGKIAKVLWLGIPLLNIKIRWWLASWLERSSNSSLSKLSWEQIAEKFHTFSTVFPNPQIKINEDLIHLQSNPWTLKNSNFLNSQTSKPNPTNRSSDCLSDFLGHWKCPSPPLRCQSSGLTEKNHPSGFTTPSPPQNGSPGTSENYRLEAVKNWRFVSRCFSFSFWGYLQVLHVNFRGCTTIRTFTDIKITGTFCINIGIQVIFLWKTKISKGWSLSQRSEGHTLQGSKKTYPTEKDMEKEGICEFAGG